MNTSYSVISIYNGSEQFAWIFIGLYPLQHYQCNMIVGSSELISVNAITQRHKPAMLEYLSLKTMAKTLKPQ